MLAMGTKLEQIFDDLKTWSPGSEAGERLIAGGGNSRSGDRDR
jgi:hypothetical protein